MEKVINISGINVPLKSTAGTPRRYKAQFKSDYFADLLKLAKTLDNGKGTGKNKNDEFSLNDFTWEALDRLNFDTVYNFVWALAKTANPQLPDPDTWFDTFDSFPIIEILPEITELLSSSIQSQKK